MNRVIFTETENTGLLFQQEFNSALSMSVARLLRQEAVDTTS